jgi:hypothetical protein
VTGWVVILALAVSGASGHELNAGALPVCSNRVINDVVKRTGCTVGDARCWARKRGFCSAYIEQRLGVAAKTAGLQPIRPEEVRAGDVAVFEARAHVAYVEQVVRDGSGRPIAVDVSEYNFGTCWVDQEVMVTDRYQVVNRRSGIALRDVDGGFLRPRPAAR